MFNIDFNIIKRTLKYFSKYKKIFVILLITTIIGGVIELIPPYFSGKVIDYAIKKQYNEILHIVALMLSFFILSAGFGLIETYISNWVLNKSICSLKHDLFSKILRLKISRFDKYSVGEFISRLEGDVGSISNFFINNLLKVIIDIITLIVSGFFIFRISFSMSMIVMITFPISAIIYFYFGKKIRAIIESTKKLSDKYFGFIQEVFVGIKEVKSLKIEKVIVGKYEGLINQFFGLQMKISLTGAYSGFSGTCVSTVMQLLLTLIGCWMIASGNLSVGLFVAFNAYMQKFIGSLQSITSINMSLQEIMVSLNRFYTIIDEVDDGDDEENEICQCIVDGIIIFDKVDFSYDIGSAKVINSLDFVIPTNSVSAIVGFSGCGKTTLLNLLMRFYDVTGGKIFIDGSNINDIGLKNLRDNISYIQQEPFIFNSSIKENLLLAKSEASNEDIISACQKAYIHNFIDSLPNKYETIIGEDGIKLSGGQKQRLAIARGILKNSKIFLLDEFTSDLDGESEYYLLKTVKSLSKSHTIIIVAHRLSTVMNISNIYVMDNGKITDSGTHDNLIKNSFVYKRLFGEQWSQYIEKIKNGEEGKHAI